jgi:hypothetical protein
MMKTYTARVTPILILGYEAEDAKIEQTDLNRAHVYEGIEAADEEQAEEKALDRFHSDVPIGVPEYVDLDVTIREN